MKKKRRTRNKRLHKPKNMSSFQEVDRGQKLEARAAGFFSLNAAQKVLLLVFLSIFLCCFPFFFIFSMFVWGLREMGDRTKRGKKWEGIKRR